MYIKKTYCYTYIYIYDMQYIHIHIVEQMQDVHSHAREQTPYIDMEHVLKQTGIQKTCTYMIMCIYIISNIHLYQSKSNGTLPTDPPNKLQSSYQILRVAGSVQRVLLEISWIILMSYFSYSPMHSAGCSGGLGGLLWPGSGPTRDCSHVGWLGRGCPDAQDTPLGHL